MLQHTAEFISGKIQSTGYLLIAAAIFCSLFPVSAQSQETLRFVIQPFMSEERTRASFQPLADYFQELTGKKVEIVTYPNFISYWSETQKTGKYDIALDTAHFIDYRNKGKDFTVLAKQPGTVSISLIVSEDALVFEAEELIGKKIATLGPPSIAAVRIDEIFDNPVRQPSVIEVNNTGQAMAMLLSGKVDAAMIPTPMVSNQMAGDGGVAVVLTTDTIPGMAISVSPAVSADVREKILKGLIGADKSESGKKMLELSNLNPFEKAANQDFFGYSDLLGLEE
jgi:ABC-type phosphate/phosphonate transport system substrate-binding protein